MFKQSSFTTSRNHLQRRTGRFWIDLWDGRRVSRRNRNLWTFSVVVPETSPVWSGIRVHRGMGVRSSPVTEFCGRVYWDPGILRVSRTGSPSPSSVVHDPYCLHPYRKPVERPQNLGEFGWRLFISRCGQGRLSSVMRSSLRKKQCMLT